MDEQRLQDYTNLLWQILTKTFESNGNPQVVYPLLEANLDKLNENFAQLWRNWKFVGLTAAVARISDLFRQFPLGNRSINLEIAITGYEKTLQVYTREAFPNEWAEIQLSLAETYSKRLCGEQAENLEQTLAYLQRALQVITREAFPERWAGIQFVIADIYKKRIRGERAENIEQAIACMEKALKVYIRDAFPERWAIILLSLADAYHARIRGEKLENQKQMIACLEGALQVYIREASPELWAQLQNFLASVYQGHLRGEQSDNLEQVLACIQNVLQVINREASPELWAQIQALLAQALLVSDYQARRGFSANNLEMDEQRLQDYLFFLQEVLQATFESNGNPKVVYPLLQENLDKLDDNFAQLLQRWATAIFVREPIDQALAIAEAIHNF
ncbi:MAG: tetratricopeptide repeat protein, partial [Coleofasciculus sp. Co-bin14]|nr:tetratricopeptide repeat protein [Coleofasciculus sp. Co-bin14]